MEVDDSEVRFGTAAVKKGFVTPDQVIKALEIQVKEDLSTGSHRHIGKIMLDQGLMSLPQIDIVINAIKQ